MKRTSIVAFLTAAASIAAVHSRHTGGIEVVYQGEACECDKPLSFCVDRPKEPSGVNL